MLGTRVATTLERLHARALPSSSLAVRAFMAEGTGRECSGCGELLERSERAYYVRMRDGEGLRFHLVCHEAWVRFKARAVS
jgi:hypothetical protein